MNKPAEIQEWQSKLTGKNVTPEIKQQLPEKHRVIAPGDMVTRDWVEDRLNVHVDADGKCTHCYFG